MGDVWIFNGTTQGREVRSTLAQRPVFLRPGEQMRVTGDAGGIEGLVEHMRSFGAEDADPENPTATGKLTLHEGELKDVPSSGILDVPAPPTPEDPERLSVAAPITTARGPKSRQNDGVEK